MRQRVTGLLAFAPVAIVFFIALKSVGEPVRPDDLWCHLATGRLIATTGAIPTSDVFSFTRAGAPYFNQPWLAQLVLFLAHRSVGLAGLLALNFAVMVGAAGIVALAARKRGAGLSATALVLLVLTPVAERGWSVRPQALAVPVFASFVLVLMMFRADRTRRAWLATLPLLSAAWANLHGSFPLGCVLVLAAGAAILLDDRDARRARRTPGRTARDVGSLLLVAAACATAPIVNPRGAAIYGYVASLLRSSPVREIAPEWRSVGLGNAEGIYVVTVLAIAGASLLRRRAWGDLAFVLPFALLELSAVRNGIWLSLVLAPIAASWVGAPPSAPAARLGARLAAAAFVTLLAGPWIKPRLVPRPYGTLAWEVRTPVAAAVALARDHRPPRRIFLDASGGSYLIWAVPSVPVFIDARVELYPTTQWHDLASLSVGNDVPRLLAAYGIDGLLLDKHQEGVLVALERANRTFALRYEDDDYAYFATAP